MGGNWSLYLGFVSRCVLKQGCRLERLQRTNLSLQVSSWGGFLKVGAAVTDESRLDADRFTTISGDSTSYLRAGATLDRVTSTPGFGD